MMKNLLSFIILTLAVCAMLSCTHVAFVPLSLNTHDSEHIKKITDTNLLFSAHHVIWYHWFDNHCDTSIGTLSVIKLSDSTIATSNLTTLPLNYICTDSIAGCITYRAKFAPPMLYYHWSNDSIHYLLHNGGGHNDNSDCYSVH